MRLLTFLFTFMLAGTVPASMASSDLGHKGIVHFICNTLSGNHHTTMDVNDFATIDMSGIHSNDSSGYDYAGFNTIEGPSVYVNDTVQNHNETRLIDIFPIDPADHPSVNLSNSLRTYTWSNYGHNNIILSPQNSGPSANQPLIEGANSAPADIRSVDSNYFAFGTTAIDPSNGILLCSGDPCWGLSPSPCYTSAPYVWQGSTVKNAVGITYCATPLATVSQSSLPSWASGCQNWVDALNNRTKGKRELPLSSPDSIPNNDTCAFLFNKGNALEQFHHWQESYDTLQLFVQKCPNTPSTWQAFGGLDADVENLLPFGNYPQDSAIWAKYRSWLYSVLYLNTSDPYYFCACVSEIFASFGYAIDDTSDQQRFKASNMEIGFKQWLLQNTSCADSQAVWTDWKNVRYSQRQLWLQDSINGNHYPYDTTIPTLSQIGYGLDTLLAKHAFFAVSNEIGPQIISNATAVPNPAGTGTVISFGISKEAYVKMELYDVLGHPLGAGDFESLCEPGNKSVPISLAGLPSGTYYARIQTAYGEVESVKIVKE